MVRRSQFAVAGRLDAFLPEFDFEELRCRWIEADPEEVWRGLMDVRPLDLALARRWTAVRGKPPSQALLSLLACRPLTMLAHQKNHFALSAVIEQPWRPTSPQEVATIDAFIRFDEPGWIKRLTAFELLPSQNGTRLCITTRVACTDPAVRPCHRIHQLLDQPRTSVAQRNLLDAVGRLAG
ncbi:hypothetical protein ABZX12_40885 [Kribbella sp. NPDC003505]|uniref:hypothetical protein n=1 Tax=Kribbella sp. NPDC003505 TaxID=3154448 RepID=UPI0033AA67F7